MPLLCQSQLASDAKLWSGISVSKKVNDFKFSIAKEVRFDENMSHLDKSFGEIGSQYKINKTLYVELNYRFNRDNDYSTESYQLIHRVDFGLSYKRKVDKFRLKWRSKIQLKSASTDENNPLVIRNKMSIKYKINKKIAPYIAYEFYYQLNTENCINRNRISLGSSFKVTDQTDLKMFYLFENKFNVKNIQHNHVYGISYSIDL
jgi:hypothetical protein